MQASRWSLNSVAEFRGQLGRKAKNLSESVLVIVTVMDIVIASFAGATRAVHTYPQGLAGVRPRAARALGMRPPIMHLHWT